MWEIFAIEGDEKKRTSFGKTVSNNGFKDVRKGKENKKKQQGEGVRKASLLLNYKNQACSKKFEEISTRDIL